MPEHACQREAVERAVDEHPGQDAVDPRAQPCERDAEDGELGERLEEPVARRENDPGADDGEPEPEAGEEEAVTKAPVGRLLAERGHPCEHEPVCGELCGVPGAAKPASGDPLSAAALT